MRPAATAAFLVSLIGLAVTAAGTLLTLPRLFDADASATWLPWVFAGVATALGIAAVRLRPSRGG